MAIFSNKPRTVSKQKSILFYILRLRSFENVTLSKSCFSKLNSIHLVKNSMLVLYRYPFKKLIFGFKFVSCTLKLFFASIVHVFFCKTIFDFSMPSQTLLCTRHYFWRGNTTYVQSYSVSNL